MNRRALLGLLLAVAVSQLLLWWLKPAPKPRQSAGPPRSGYSLENFTLDVLNQHGDIGFSLRAPHLQRRDADESLFIEQPRFRLPGSNGSHWQGQAEHGWVSGDGEQLKLSGEVLMTRPATDTLGQARIKTADLTAWPGEKRLQTSARAEITDPGRILTGTGLKANLVTHTMELLANVHGTLQPSRKR
ncbi:MAG: LPS export ABC transporter periplasmic protein LptC [Rhodanobacteraceae bacterium]